MLGTVTGIEARAKEDKTSRGAALRKLVLLEVGDPLATAGSVSVSVG